MNGLASIPGATQAELKSLRQSGIASVDDFWVRLGTDLEPGLDRIATDTGLPKQRLLEILADGTAQEQEHAPTTQRVGPRPVWLLGTLGLAALLVTPLLAPRSPVPVALYDLETGRVLRAADFRVQARPV